MIVQAIKLAKPIRVLGRSERHERQDSQPLAKKSTEFVASQLPVAALTALLRIRRIANCKAQ